MATITKKTDNKSTRKEKSVDANELKKLINTHTFKESRDALRIDYMKIWLK